MGLMKIPAKQFKLLFVRVFLKLSVCSNIFKKEMKAFERVFGFDPRSLSAFRIAIGALLVYESLHCT